MFEKFLSENADNFRQRYEGTYGFYRDGTKRLLVKLVSISPDQCQFVDGRDVMFSIRPDHPDNIGFEFLPPKAQWYNTKIHGAVHTQRLAHRQFQRGVTSKTLEIMRLKGGALHPIRVDFRNLSAIYEDGMKPDEAFPSLKEGGSVAISGQFALGSGIVYLLKEPIGTYIQDGKRFTFKLEEPQLWRTEISDALNLMGCSANIS